MLFRLVPVPLYCLEGLLENYLEDRLVLGYLLGLSDLLDLVDQLVLVHQYYQ